MSFGAWWSEIGGGELKKCQYRWWQTEETDKNHKNLVTRSYSLSFLLGSKKNYEMTDPRLKGI